MKTKYVWLALMAALAVIAFAAIAAGCGDDNSPSSAVGNGADAAFISDMTAHHQGAIDMARLAQDKAAHPEIRQLVDDIVSAQEGEISVMKTIRRDVHAMGENGDGHMGMSDADMGMDMDMTGLEDAKPFDKAFIDAMIPHHRGAIAMANELLDEGEQPALQQMARDIIDAQTKEIAQMREWRTNWYGAGSQP